MPRTPVTGFSAEYFTDSVGRRRKLSHGAMVRIREQFADGERIHKLAEAFGVSTSLIRCVVYDTARNADLERITAPQN